MERFNPAETGWGAKPASPSSASVRDLLRAHAPPSTDHHDATLGFSADSDLREEFSSELVDRPVYRGCGTAVGYDPVPSVPRSDQLLAPTSVFQRADIAEPDASMLRTDITIASDGFASKAVPESTRSGFAFSVPSLESRGAVRRHSESHLPTASAADTRMGTIATFCAASHSHNYCILHSKASTSDLVGAVTRALTARGPWVCVPRPSGDEVDVQPKHAATGSVRFVARVYSDGDERVLVFHRRHGDEGVLCDLFDSLRDGELETLDAEPRAQFACPRDGVPLSFECDSLDLESRKHAQEAIVACASVAESCRPDAIERTKNFVRLACTPDMSTSTSMRAHGFEWLSSLSETAEGCGLLLRAGGVLPLVDFLCSGADARSELWCTALECLLRIMHSPAATAAATECVANRKQFHRVLCESKSFFERLAPAASDTCRCTARAVDDQFCAAFAAL